MKMVENQVTRYRSVVKDCPDCCQGIIQSAEALHQQLWIMHPPLSVIKATLKKFKENGSVECMRCDGKGYIEYEI